MSGDFLQLMAQASRERVVRARSLCPEPLLRRQALATSPPPRMRRSAQGFDLIAEVKLRSPALGRLSPDRIEDAAAAESALAVRVRSYADAGAALVSVLTEPSRFDGSLTHLEQAARALDGSIPVMRKDFITDPYQIYEARAAGAGGVLLIVRMLAQGELAALIDACIETQMFALLEAFDVGDLALAAELVGRFGARAALLVGVNCRDLTTLQVVPERLESLAQYLPLGVPRVAESGIENDADAARVARLGYEMALVGGALMKCATPADLVQSLLASGRAAVSARERVACR